MTTKDNPKSGLFVYLLMLTAIFSLLEISYFIQSSGLYLGDFKTISDHLSIPVAILPGIIFYVGVQIVVHVIFTLLVWMIARLVGILLRCSWKQTQTLGFYLWGMALITVLLANQHYFPNSKYADLMRILFDSSLAPMLFKLLLVVCVIELSLALLGAIVLLRNVSWIKISVVITLLLVLVGINVLNDFEPLTPVQDAATVAKPNIIIIGVDSLRPDYIGYFGSPLATPHLDSFLNQSVVFAEAITPIARTFPAWVSLLTGQYPKQTGARFDLMDQTSLNLTATLPAILRQQGYETLFAMDETRFSNIDRNLGFDEIVTPPVGLNDFLLGTFNDFPLSNLLVNTRIGQWLFPYSFANRPAFITYEPKSFQRLLQPILAKNRTKPLFLAIHFCLPHFPYLWADAVAPGAADVTDHYHASIERIDHQLNDFLTLLKQDHVLDHSIVILLSDHGEALELPGDRVTTRDAFIPGLNNPASRIPRFYPASIDHEAVDQSAGHGTDVLSFAQYHPVLAFRFYGLAEKRPQLVPGIVTLLDIKPTLLRYLGIATQGSSGISLNDYIDGKKPAVVSAQDIFIESDFSPEAVHSVHPETRQIVFEGIDFFEINPITTRLTIKKEMGKLIISSKQYADIHGSWILALYPQSVGGMMLILVDLNTGQWTNDLRIPFALKSPAKQMLQALKTFYGNEVSLIQNV